MPNIRTVILLRHGDAEKMSNEIFFGRTDTALTENGRLAAQNAAHRLSRMRVDAIYTGPLARCKQTARLLKLAAEILVEEGFNERSFGKWEGKKREDCRKEEEAWNTFYNLNGAPPEGESAEDFHKRVIEAYDKVLDTTEDKPVLLIVAHHSVICSIAAYALGLGPNGAYHFHCAPGGMSCIDYIDGFATLSRWNA